MKPQEFAELLGVSVKTLHRWDKTGKLVAKRTLSNHRYYTEEDVAVAKGLKPIPSKRKNILYCRVSSKKQLTELENQKNSMLSFLLAKGIATDEIICEIGGGLNFKRPLFLKLVTSALEGKVDLIIVAHKDRLCRFAFELLETLFARNGCQILVANQEQLSPQQELVEDMLAIIHCFSCRIYGSRSYANQKTKAFREILDIPSEKMLTLRKEIDL
jgi:predicted site-specific integrase-resolvase